MSLSARSLALCRWVVTEVLEIVPIRPILLVAWYIRLSRGSVDLGSDLVSRGPLERLADRAPGLV